MLLVPDRRAFNRVPARVQVQRFASNVRGDLRLTVELPQGVAGRAVAEPPAQVVQLVPVNGRVIGLRELLAVRAQELPESVVTLLPPAVDELVMRQAEWQRFPGFQLLAGFRIAAPRADPAKACAKIGCVYLPLEDGELDLIGLELEDQEPSAAIGPYPALRPMIGEVPIIRDRRGPARFPTCGEGGRPACIPRPFDPRDGRIVSCGAREPGQSLRMRPPIAPWSCGR